MTDQPNGGPAPVDTSAEAVARMVRGLRDNRLDVARKAAIEAADLIKALAARVAELGADLNGVVSECRRMRGEYNAAAQHLAAAEARVAALTEAAKEVELAFDNVDAQIDDEGEFTERAWEQLRAALKGATHD